VANAPDPNYDYLALVTGGIVLTREIQDCLAATYAANGYTPLTQAQIDACTGPQPPFPDSLPRFPDSNPPPKLG